jgi:hypothetical protein
VPIPVGGQKHIGVIKTRSMHCCVEIHIDHIVLVNEV